MLRFQRIGSIALLALVGSVFSDSNSSKGNTAGCREFELRTPYNEDASIPTWYPGKNAVIRANVGNKVPQNYKVILDLIKVTDSGDHEVVHNVATNVPISELKGGFKFTVPDSLAKKDNVVIRGAVYDINGNRKKITYSGTIRVSNNVSNNGLSVPINDEYVPQVSYDVLPPKVEFAKETVSKDSRSLYIKGGVDSEGKVVLGKEIKPKSSGSTGGSLVINTTITGPAHVVPSPQPIKPTVNNIVSPKPTLIPLPPIYIDGDSTTQPISTQTLTIDPFTTGKYDSAEATGTGEEGGKTTGTGTEGEGGDATGTEGGETTATGTGEEGGETTATGTEGEGGDVTGTDGGEASSTDGGEASGTDGGEASGTDGGEASGTDGGEASGTDGGEEEDKEEDGESSDAQEGEDDDQEGKDDEDDEYEDEDVEDAAFSFTSKKNILVVAVIALISMF